MESSEGPTQSAAPVSASSATVAADLASVLAGRRLFQLMRLEWSFALLVTVLLAFAIYSHTAPAAAAGADSSTATATPMSLAVAGVIAFLASIVIFPMLLKRAVRGLAFPLTMAQALRVSFFPFSVRLAFCLLIALIGFFGAHMLGQQFYYAFWAGSILALALATPREAQFLRAVDESRSLV